MVDIAAYTAGGISYEYMRDCPIWELTMISDRVEHIAKEREREANKVKPR